MVQNILDLMVIQHGLLESLFSTFKSEIKTDSKKARETLSEFSWELKKHFFAEEQVIFNFMSWKEPGISAIIDQLKKEHSMMLDGAEKISAAEDFMGQEIVESFAELLKSHRGIEEKDLYPKLDSALSDVQKEQIINRVTQIKQ